jgi:hypothetical protein
MQYFWAYPSFGCRQVSLIKFLKYIIGCLVLFISTQASAQTVSRADSLRQVAAANKAKLEKDRQALKAKQARDKAVRDSTTAANKATLQKNIAARKKSTDSIAKVRVAFRDSVNKVRDIRTKERERIAKYKNSRKYTDSIARARKEKADSISFTRKIKMEQQKDINQQKLATLKAQRKQESDARKDASKAKLATLKAQREANLAAIKEKRKKISDSIAAKKKITADSLLARKKAKLDFLKKNFKTEDEKKLAAAMKAHEKKKTAYSNQLFLKKPWTLQRKVYQNTVTRYNYFYNATNRYNESIDNLQKTAKDDYSKLLTIDAMNLESSANAVGGNMDSVIKKCATSIQIHDPRSKWFDDLYLLMGKAYFLKNDLDNAIATFQYVANEYKPKKKQEPKPIVRKPKSDSDTAKPMVALASEENYKGVHKFNHRPSRNDALLWMLRCYLQMKAYGDAQTLAGILESDKNFPKRLRGDLAMLTAQLYLDTEDKPGAIAQLTIASEDKAHLSKTSRRRATYLLAQLLAEQAEYAKSTKQFEQVLKMQPDLDMDFYAKLNIAKNAVLLDEKNTAKGENLFTSIVKDGKYEPYYDQAYLTLGLLQAKSNEEKAIKNLKKAIEITKPPSKVKVQAFRALGDLYFGQFEYVKSKVCYDTVLSMMTDAEADYTSIDRRRNLLKDLVRELDVISNNDSLIALSTKSKKEQMAAVRKAVKAQKDIAETQKELKAANNIDNASEAMQGTLADWYFSKNLLMQNGKSNFIQTWGDRANVDNWRRKSAISNFAQQQDKEQKEVKEELEQAKEEESADGKEKQLLAQIPTTPEALELCHKARSNSIYNVGSLYYAGFQNDEKAVSYLEMLLKEYPNFSNMQQAYYTAYLSYKRLPDAVKANYFLDKLNAEYPEGALTALASDTNVVNAQRQSGNEVLAYYDSTYQLYKSSNYSDVMPRVSFARTEYKRHKLLAKFDLLSAMSLLQTGKKQQGKSELENVITTYAGEEEATFAQDILALLRKADTSMKDSNDLIKDLKPSFDQQANAGFDGYSIDLKATHYYMFVVKKIDNRLTPMKASFSDFNAIKHSLEKIQSTLSLVDQNTGILFFKQFKDAKTAMAYMKEVQDEKTLYGVYANGEFEMAVISELNYNYFKNTRDLAGYMKFFKKNYK